MHTGKTYSKTCLDGGREIGLDMTLTFFFMIVILTYMNAIVTLIRATGFLVMNYKVTFMNCTMRSSLQRSDTV